MAGKKGGRRKKRIEREKTEKGKNGKSERKRRKEGEIWASEAKKEGENDERDRNAKWKEKIVWEMEVGLNNLSKVVRFDLNEGMVVCGYHVSQIMVVCVGKLFILRHSCLPYKDGKR